MVQTFAKGDTLTAYHASITGQAVWCKEPSGAVGFYLRMV